MPGFALDDTARAAGYRVEGHDTVSSTSAIALDAGRAGDPGRLWVAALQQTAGRGRRGRAWQSPHGNLAASLLIVPDAPAAALAGLGFVAGVALNAALSDLLPHMRVSSGLDGADGRMAGGRARVALKWPNDVMADGAKLAGILLETTIRPDGAPAVVIGIGVNVVAAPDDLPYPATALNRLGYALDAQTVFAALAANWARCYDIWNGGLGTARIMETWRAGAAGLGAEVAVQRENGVVRGIFESIDDAGHLIVRDDEGHRFVITTGDVHFGTTATLR